MGFGAGVLGAEPPINSGRGGVALGLVGVDGPGQSGFVGVASPEASSGQHAEFDLRHVQPTGVFGRVVKLQPLDDAPRLSRREGLIQRSHAVSVQVV